MRWYGLKVSKRSSEQLIQDTRTVTLGLPINMPFISAKLWTVSGFMKVCFNSDNYVFRIFTNKAITIAGVYVRKMLSGKKR